MKIGIDIGNKFAHVAIKKPNGNLLTIPDAFFSDQPFTPLQICLEQNAALIGLSATIKEQEGAELCYSKSFKNQLGQATPILRDRNFNNWLPSSLLSLILKKLKNDCEAFSGEPVHGAVLTVPASFDSKQQKSVLIAASLTDIPVLDIVAEPIAAIQYFTQLQEVSDSGMFLICDMGESALKVAIICVEEERKHLVVQNEMPTLGTHQINSILETFILKILKEQAGLASINSHFDLLQVKKLAYSLLFDLSSKDSYYFKKKIKLNKRDISLLISRKQLENELDFFVNQLAQSCIDCVQEAHLVSTDLDAIFLVGASAELPIIRSVFAKQLQTPEQQIIVHSPTKANAFGAAIIASTLSLEKNNLLPAEFKSRSSYNIGIKTMDSETNLESLDIVIHQALDLPCKGNRVYHFIQEEGVPCVIDIVIKLSDGEPIQTIGQLELNNIFDESPQQAVEIVFTNTLLGTISVQAYSPQSGMNIEEEFNYLPEAEIVILEQKQLISATLINDLLG